MLLKRCISVLPKLRPTNIRFYIEMLKEELRRFKYPVPFYKKLFVNYFRLLKFRRLVGKSRKLHIGCGDVKIDGFINIDTVRAVATDFISCIEDLPKYVKPSSIDVIYSSHMLEHLSNSDAVQVLKMYYDFLRIGGELKISVPDFKKLANIVNKYDLSLEEMRMVQAVLMGGQNTKYNYHKSAYWFELLKGILAEIGFGKISEYTSCDNIGDIKDSSLLKIRGQAISVNVAAFKEA